jgi:hypothetical protein
MQIFIANSLKLSIFVNENTISNNKLVIIN